MTQTITDRTEARRTQHSISLAAAENELLICVARQHLGSSNDQQIRAWLREDLDWNYLMTTANRHGVIPLLHYHLNTVSSAVPHQTMKRLRDLTCEIARSNFSLTGELIKLLDFLNAHGVQAVPFKGPALALWAYGDPGFRQFIDLDVLIRKHDVVRVSELLIGQGFRLEPDLTRAQRAALLRFGSAYTFTNDSGVVLDLHWGFVERHSAFEIDTDRLWDRLARLTVGGKVLPTLSSEDLLLVLCLHGFTHNWQRLGWICDIAGLISRQEHINWQIVRQNAAKAGVGRILLVGLFLASELLNARLPSDVLKELQRDTNVRRLGEKFQKQLFIERRAPKLILNEVALQLSMRERRADKVRSLFSLVATPRNYDWMFAAVPDSLFFLYYVIRPIRLMGKYCTKLLKGSDPAPSTTERDHALS